MKATELIYHAFGNPPVETEPAEGKCMVCGKNISEGIPWKKVIGSSFTNWDEFKSKSSTYVCRECAVTLMTGEIATQLRRSSFIVTEKGIEFFKNSDLAAKLFTPPKPPFIFCVTFSFKKHNAFHSVIAYSRDLYSIRQEDKLIYFDRKKAAKTFRSMVRLYYGGFTKQEILTNSYHPKRILNYGIDEFEKEEAVLYFERGSELFELLAAALPSARRENYLKILKRREKDGNGKSRKSSQTALFGMETH